MVKIFSFKNVILHLNNVCIAIFFYVSEWCNVSNFPVASNVLFCFKAVKGGGGGGRIRVKNLNGNIYIKSVLLLLF